MPTVSTISPFCREFCHSSTALGLDAPEHPSMAVITFTTEEILARGLEFFKFDDSRQRSVRREQNCQEARIEVGSTKPSTTNARLPRHSTVGGIGC
jgi:hypothetical protein